METNLKLEPGGFARWTHSTMSPPFLVRDIENDQIFVFTPDGGADFYERKLLTPIPSTPELIERFKPIIEPLARAVGFVPGPKFKPGERVYWHGVEYRVTRIAWNFEWLYEVNKTIVQEEALKPYIAPAPPPVIEVGDTVSHPYISENVKVEAMGSNDTVCLRYPNGSLECCRLDDLTLVSIA